MFEEAMGNKLRIEKKTHRYEINCTDGNSYKISLPEPIDKYLGFESIKWIRDQDGDLIQIQHITRVRPLR